MNFGLVLPALIPSCYFVGRLVGLLFSQIGRG